MYESRTDGLMIGLVTNLDDPEKLGRVKVKFPHLDGKESDWTRLAMPMAGPKRGTFFRPEVGDEVLVGFEYGDSRRAYILGSLWSQADQPPPDDGQPTQNNWRFIQSRSGHIILLDDTPGKEKILLQDKDGQRRVVIDSANQKIQVQCDTGSVEVEAPAGDVKIKAINITLEATGELKLNATGNVTIQGMMVNIN